MLVPNMADLKIEENRDVNLIQITNMHETVSIFNTPDLENPKERKSLIKSIESIIRTSPEYSEFIGYLKNVLNLTKCLFHPDVDITELKQTKLEFHHYPFTLYDITDVMLTKYVQSHSTINPYEIAESVMRLHYELKVGLVPLSKTIHQLTHAGKKFINLSYVNQSYLKFIAEYSETISEDLINNWQNLKSLSIKQDEGELEEDDILANITLELDMDDVELPKALKKEIELTDIC